MRPLFPPPPDAGFDAFWSAVNKELAFLSLELRRVNVPPEPDAAPVRYVGIVNKARALARRGVLCAPPYTRQPRCSRSRACVRCVLTCRRRGRS